MGFSVTAGGQGGQLAVVKRVWDRRQCPSLQPGDAIIKINGADVQSLSFAQVILQKVILPVMFSFGIYKINLLYDIFALLGAAGATRTYQTG